ncbi:MAG: hypothetical protein HY921_05090 [Elusimicrobia bacterium]|nr:hypothetical protein [Elusimicrobiota bacterium]
MKILLALFCLVLCLGSGHAASNASSLLQWTKTLSSELSVNSVVIAKLGLTADSNRVKKWLETATEQINKKSFSEAEHLLAVAQQDYDQNIRPPVESFLRDMKRKECKKIHERFVLNPSRGVDCIRGQMLYNITDQPTYPETMPDVKD